MRHERQSRVTRADRNTASSGIGLSEVSSAPMSYVLDPLIWHDRLLLLCPTLPQHQWLKAAHEEVPANMTTCLQELDAHLTNWAQLLGDRYGFVTGKWLPGMTLPSQLAKSSCLSAATVCIYFSHQASA